MSSITSIWGYITVNSKVRTKKSTIISDKEIWQSGQDRLL